MIEITKVDEVNVRVTADDAGIEQDLADYFTFEVPGAKFMPSVKNRYWDGKIRLYSTQKKLLYTGLVQYVQAFAEERDIPVHIKYEPAFQSVDWSFIDVLQLPFEPRDYQRAAVEECVSYGRSLILSPTASGKSLTIYMLTQYYDGKKLIIVPTTSLVHQMASDFKEYGYPNDVHKIMSGQERAANEDIVVSTWQSIYKMPKPFFNQFNVIVGDEAHLFKAKSLTSIMSKTTDVKHKFGFTGTLDGTQTHKLVLEGLFGPVKKVVTTSELMEQEHLASLTVKCLILQYPQDIARVVSKAKYQEEITFLINNRRRNKFLVNLALSQQGNTLVLFERVDDHGQILFGMLKERIENSVEFERQCFFIHGGVGGDEREQVRKIVENEKDSIIVASYGTFSTGVNIRNLHTVIFASPSKSRIRVLQSIGRGLRTSDTKTKATLYDVADMLSYNGRNNHTLNHFTERMKYYNEEQFTYKIYNIDLKGQQ